MRPTDPQPLALLDDDGPVVVLEEVYEARARRAVEYLSTKRPAPGSRREQKVVRKAKQLLRGGL